MIRFLATSPWYLDHMAPLVRAMGDEATLHVPTSLQHHARRLGLRSTSAFGRTNDPVVVAAIGDLKRLRERYGQKRIVLMEHGAGQSYSTSQSGSYAGSGGRHAELFLHPGPHPAARDRAAYPNARVEVVGCPKLDALPRLGQPNERPVVAVSFHWDCLVAPETRTGFYEFRGAVAELAKHYKLIGHGHPRFLPEITDFYTRRAIEVVPDFADVCRRADLYICDNSSTLFEFAATGRPVVVLNPSSYRREVTHGLRFWEAASVGVNVDFTRRDLPGVLRAAVAHALADPPEQVSARNAALDLVYAYRTGAAQRAAAVLLDYASSLAVAA